MADTGRDGPGGLKQQEAGNYVYDPIGNLVADKASGISEIKWTPYGKMSSVRKSDGSRVLYAYDASGNRAWKKHEWAGGSRETAYARDASGNLMAVYVNGVLESQPIYGSSRLGEYRGGAKRGQRKAGARRYELSNHLGNVLAVVTDRKLPDGDGGYLAETVQLNDYYPFGLSVLERSWAKGGGKYRFGFQGQEQENEVWDEAAWFKYRLHNPAIGRFFSVDPLAAKYPHNSPYAFSENQVIAFNELEGLEVGTFSASKKEGDNIKLALQTSSEIKVQIAQYTSGNARVKNGYLIAYQGKNFKDVHFIQFKSRGLVFKAKVGGNEQEFKGTLTAGSGELTNTYDYSTSDNPRTQVDSGKGSPYFEEAGTKFYFENDAEGLAKRKITGMLDAPTPSVEHFGKDGANASGIPNESDITETVILTTYILEKNQPVAKIEIEQKNYAFKNESGKVIIKGIEFKINKVEAIDGLQPEHQTQLEKQFPGTKIKK